MHVPKLPAALTEGIGQLHAPAALTHEDCVSLRASVDMLASQPLCWRNCENDSFLLWVGAEAMEHRVKAASAVGNEYRVSYVVGEGQGRI